MCVKECVFNAQQKSCLKLKAGYPCTLPANCLDTSEKMNLKCIFRFLFLYSMQKQKNRRKIKNKERATLVEQLTTLQVTSILISLSKKIAFEFESLNQSAALEATAALVTAGHRGSRGTVELFLCGSLAVCRPLELLRA